MSSVTSPATRRATLTALAKKAWKQPQQLWLRKAFFQIHLWAGLLFALYIIAIGISGSILVFRDELIPRPHIPHPVFDASACTPQRLVAAMDTTSKAHPELIVDLALCPSEANPFYAITLRPKIESPAPSSLIVYVHSQTGEVVGQVNEATSWVGILEDFHINLLLKRNGRQWNGAAAAALLLLVVTGIVLWWPGVRNWSRAFKIDFERSWKRINWDLHSAIGIWALFFVFTWALTGVYFAWEGPFETAINRISQIRTAAYPTAEIERLAKRPISLAPSTLSLPGVLRDSEARSPHAQLAGLYFGSGPNAILTVYMARAHLGDYTNTDFLYFDQQNGQHLLTWHRGLNETFGDWFLWLFAPLHFGTSWGLGGKIVWFLLGLALPAMALTGFLMYWNRWLRKQLHW